jgi:hypothetical protein
MEVLLYEWRPVAHHQERVNAACFAIEDRLDRPVNARRVD